MILGSRTILGPTLDPLVAAVTDLAAAVREQTAAIRENTEALRGRPGPPIRVQLVDDTSDTALAG